MGEQTNTYSYISVARHYQKMALSRLRASTPLHFGGFFAHYVFGLTLIISYFADEWLPVNGHYLFPNINGYQNRFIF